MHVLLIHQAFAALDEAGGTRHAEMAHYLASQGHQVTIIASPVSYLTGKNREKSPHWITREVPEPGVTLLRTYTYSALHRSFFHRIISFLSFMVSSFFVGLGIKNVTVVWGTSPPIFQGWTAWLLARLKRVPFIFEVRDLWPAFAIAVGVLHNKTLIALSQWLESFLYRHADLLMVNSPGFIGHVTSRGAKNVTLIPNGVDVNMFDPSLRGDSLRRQWGCDSQFVVLYAGAHGISNDLTVVLDAAETLKDHPEIRFVFVGDGKEKSHLQTYASEKKLPNVLFLPAFPKNEMKEVLAASDACVAILKPLEMYKTTYPNKVFDYMAAGRPTICCIDGVIRQVIEAAQGGIFVPPGNAKALAETVLELSLHQEQTLQMGTHARKYVEAHFNRSDLAAQLEHVFLEQEARFM